MTADSPRVLCIGGLEATGRMGLLADAEAVRARGGVPLLVATAVTAQGVRTFRVEPVRPGLLRAQLRAVLELGPPAARRGARRSAAGRAVDAVKVGLVPSATHARVLGEVLASLRVPVVVDPVVCASAGGRLSGLSPRGWAALAGRDAWLTPNAVEAAWLLGSAPLATPDDGRAAGARLVRAGWTAVVVKGGHLAATPGGPVVDVLVTGDGAREFRSPRLARGADVRGTGCRFAAALATELGRGTGPAEAVARARLLVRGHLRRALRAASPE